MAGIASTEVLRLHEMPFGAQILPERHGTRFQLWAPSAENVDLVIEDQFFQMQAAGEGWFSLITPEAGHGTLYQFLIDGKLHVPDPASRFQPRDVHGPSQVIDPGRFEWRDGDWRGRPWEEVVLYELHTGTFSPEGTFKGIEKKLDHFVELGVTAIELMPISDFPGSRNWGYDGVLHFAPDNSYGTPDELKELVQAAHAKGLMVFLDVVYNHFGPEGNYLHAYAKDFFTDRYSTPWGAAINFEGLLPVREFFIENALYWLKEYHLDGLRFDAVHAIYDESERHFLNQLAETVRARMAETEPGRHIHLVLENDDNNATYLTGDKRNVFNAQWNDDFHHAMHVITSGDAGGYYADYAEGTSAKPAVAHVGRCLTEGYAYQGDASPYRGGKLRGESSAHLSPTAFVNFLQNHDQIGNRAFGDRLIRLADTRALKAALEVLLLAPSIPMIYMGEEWETEKPFLFFCDFSDELAPLVTEGRRKEFAQFPEFSDPETRERIPDPAAVKTFQDSCLDWDELKQPKHRQWFAFYQQLLAVRKEQIIPRLPELVPEAGAHTFEIYGHTAIHVQWKFRNGESLALIANLGPEPVSIHAKPDVIATIYASEPGLETGLERWPAWSVCWMRTR